MTNYEKYKDEILKADRECKIHKFIADTIPELMNTRTAEVGIMLFVKWCNEEYKEPEVDWSKVKVDTPSLVKSAKENTIWTNRYFAKYENGKVFAWGSGRTSWSSLEINDVVDWEYAKLAEDNPND